MTDKRRRRGSESGRCAVSLIVVLAIGAGVAAFGDDDPRIPSADEQSHTWQLSFGGKLYDNWFIALRAPTPSDRHPLMPDGVATTAANSWRCVTCHGWDYRGAVPGAGTLGAFENDPAAIAIAVRSPGHGYGPELIPDDALVLLAEFLAAGRSPVGRFYEPATGAAVGDWLAGRVIFQSVCLSCHQLDGLAYIEGEPGDRPALGWLARNKPDQVLHKIMNGQPGADMVSLRFLGETTIADLLAYLQLLPDP